MDIKINFSVPKGCLWQPLSLIIRWSEYKKSLNPFRIFGLYHSSHTSFRIDKDVWEAVLFLGVRKINYSKWLEKNKINKTVSMEVTEDELKTIKTFLEGSVGVPYSTLEVLGILLKRIILLIFKKDIPEPFHSINRKVKCTELVYEALVKAQILPAIADLDGVGVRDVENMLRESKRQITWT